MTYENKAQEKVKLIDFARQNKGSCVSCLFKNSTHNSVTDFVIHLPRELKFVGMVESVRDLEKYTKFYGEFTKNWMNIIIERGKGLKQKNSEIYSIIIEKTLKKLKALMDTIILINDEL